MIKVAQVILPASLYRTESRGYCQRVDFPERDDENWLKNTIITKEKDDIKIKAEPVEMLFMGPEDVMADEK